MGLDKPYYFIHEAMEVLSCTEDDIYRYFHTKKLTPSLFVENEYFLVIDPDSGTYYGKILLTGVLDIFDYSDCDNFFGRDTSEFIFKFNSKFSFSPTEIKPLEWDDDDPIWLSLVLPKYAGKGIPYDEFRRTDLSRVRFMHYPKIKAFLGEQEIDDFERYIDYTVSHEPMYFSEDERRYAKKSMFEMDEKFSLSPFCPQRRNLVVTKTAMDVFLSRRGAVVQPGEIQKFIPTKEEAKKGGSRKNYKRGLQDVINRITIENNSNNRITKGFFIKWINDNAGLGVEGYTFSDPDITGCEGIYIDEGKVCWVSRAGVPCELSLDSLQPYFSRSVKE